MNETKHQNLPFFGIPKLAGYLPGYGKLLFAMVFFGTLGSVMDVVIRQNKLAAIRIRQPEIQADIRIMES